MCWFGILAWKFLFLEYLFLVLILGQCLKDCARKATFCESFVLNRVGIVCSFKCLVEFTSEDILSWSYLFILIYKWKVFHVFNGKAFNYKFNFYSIYIGLFKLSLFFFCRSFDILSFSINLSISPTLSNLLAWRCS